MLLLERKTDVDGSHKHVSVWGWQGLAVDQGDEAAEWVREVIGRPVRLVGASEQHPRHVEGNKRLGRVGFADGFPLLITSTSSIAELNKWLVEAGKDPVPADRFRANIVLDGLEPFQEDWIKQIEVVAGNLSMVLKRAKACGRCPIPDTDQSTGERSTAVRSALGKNGRRGVHSNAKKYGNDKEIFFGQNFLIEMPKGMRDDQTVWLREGEEVDVMMGRSTNWQAA